MVIQILSLNSKTIWILVRSNSQDIKSFLFSFLSGTQNPAHPFLVLPVSPFFSRACTLHPLFFDPNRPATHVTSILCLLVSLWILPFSSLYPRVSWSPSYHFLICHICHHHPPCALLPGHHCHCPTCTNKMTCTNKWRTTVIPSSTLLLHSHPMYSTSVLYHISAYVFINPWLSCCLALPHRTTSTPMHRHMTICYTLAGKDLTTNISPCTTSLRL